MDSPWRGACTEWAVQLLVERSNTGQNCSPKRRGGGEGTAGLKLRFQSSSELPSSVTLDKSPSFLKEIGLGGLLGPFP